MQPRWSLAALSAFVAGVLGWAAAVLPWGSWTLFAILTSAVALSHVLTTVVAVIGHPRRLFLWRVQSMVSLAYLAYCAWNVSASAMYVAELYGSLGRGIGVGLAACLAILALLTVPLSVWGIAATGGIRAPRRARAAALVKLLAVGAGWILTGRAAAADPRGALDREGWLEGLRQAVPAPSDRVAAPGPDRSLMRREPAGCERPIQDTPVTILATHRVVVGRSNAVTTSCVQADDAAAALARLEEILRGATRGPIKLDVITGVQPLGSVLPVVDSMLLRPGFDGVCFQDRCLAPWQLVATEAFITHTPLPFVPELRFGIDPEELRKSLDAPPGGIDGLTRIETVSAVVDEDGALHALLRGRVESGPEPTAANLAEAGRAAQDHIAAAQIGDGRFRYTLDPHTGTVSYRGFSIPRQAGTTLVICELGERSERIDAVAARSLKQLASLLQNSGDVSAMRYPATREARRVGLGSTALSLISFLSCRDRVGDVHDARIGKMARFLLTMQRPDGGFHPLMDMRRTEPIPGPDPLYAGGQAVFALSLLEKLATDTPSDLYPEASEVRDAVERSMGYFARDYWPSFVRQFFFIEENWHCLAARASLGHHRNDAYERFCLDYVDFKRRLILDEESDVDPTLVGGYGFGNVLLPHNTGTAGFGEALAAAMAVRRARGEERDSERVLMERALRFLLRQQWTAPECYACTLEHRVLGGMSEHMGSPHIRIDYVQHSWAAMGHGGAVLQGN